MDWTKWKNWYAISINTNKEKATKAELLARRAIFNDKYLNDVEYLQKKEMVVDKGGKRKVKNTLLMSGYLLVQVTPYKEEDENGNIVETFPPETFDMILGTPGIKFFVNCDKQKPRAFKPKDVKRLFDMCDDAHLEVKQNILNDYQEGDILDVIDGPFVGYKCEVVNIQGSKILGQIDMFGRVIPVEFTKEQVYKK